MEMEKDGKRISMMYLDAETVPLKNEFGTKKHFFDMQLRYIVVEKLGWCNGNHHRRTLCYALKSVNGLPDCKLYLRDQWADESVKLDGEHINLVEPRIFNGDYFVDSVSGLVVFRPDDLISVTAVATALFCSRKSALAEKFRVPKHDKIMFEGILAHELLERAMSRNVETAAGVNDIVKEMCKFPWVIQEAYELKMSTNDLLRMLKQLVPYVCKFIKRNILRDALQVIDIEDNYWNPTYGLKGKLDATVRLNQINKIAPLELKTGNQKNALNPTKEDLSHSAQAQLYSLLMSHRYEDVTQAVIYYIKESRLIKNQVQKTHIRNLILTRNRLAMSKLTKNGELTSLDVPAVDFNHACQKCDYLTTCSSLVRSKPLRQEATNTEKSLFAYADSYLTESEIAFFRRWFSVITLEIEEFERNSTVKSLWQESLEERELKGKCIAHLQFIQNELRKNNDSCLMKFLRKGANRNGSDFFLALEIKEQDFIIIGTSNELCIGYGTVFEINAESQTVTIQVDRAAFQSCIKDETVRFTIDKVNSSSPLTVQYSYLQDIMKDNPMAKRIRQSVVHKVSVVNPDRHRQVVDDINANGLGPKRHKYNEAQASAITRALQTDSCLCIHGMPGTGKTKTICQLVSLLHREGNKVLVAAYTSMALDNLLMNLNKAERGWIKILRIGKPKIPYGKKYTISCTSTYEATIDDVDTLASTLEQADIVGTTLLNLKHPFLRLRQFDYVIIDEASMALPTSAFGVMSLAPRFILFGDPCQLPSVVQGASKELIGDDDSLFKMLSTPENTCTLRQQYRMNGAIMDLANNLIYQNKMKCNTKTRTAFCHALKIPRVLQYFENNGVDGERLIWLAKVAQPEWSKSVIWLDTSKVHAHDTRKDGSLINDHEANIVEEIIKMLFTLQCIFPCDIGVISPYREQVTLVKKRVENWKHLYDGPSVLSHSELDVSTIDQFQGQEREVIIVTFTKSRPLNSNETEVDSADTQGGILNDIRRLNVAITRAKCKLILIGDLKYLKTKFEPFKTLSQILAPDQFYQFVEPVPPPTKDTIEADTPIIFYSSEEDCSDSEVPPSPTPTEMPPSPKTLEPNENCVTEPQKELEASLSSAETENYVDSSLSPPPALDSLSAKSDSSDDEVPTAPNRKKLKYDKSPDGPDSQRERIPFISSAFD